MQRLSVNKIVSMIIVVLFFIVSNVSAQTTSAQITPVQVLPAQSEVVVSNKKCPIISSVLKINFENNPLEVYRLQTFLNEYESAGLKTSGQFDIATENAVKTFQKKYSETILKPWGATRASGIVSITTIKKINNIACSIPMVLDQDELDKIVNYSDKDTKNSIENNVKNSTQNSIRNSIDKVVNIEVVPTKKDTKIKVDPQLDPEKKIKVDPKLDPVSKNESFMTVKFWWYLKELFE